MEKRKDTLLIEYIQNVKSSHFMDKQIGEKDDTLQEFDKAVLRLQRERQTPLFSRFPIALNAAAIIPHLKPEAEELPAGSLITRVSGWKISELDAAVAESIARFSEELNRKLKKPKSLKQGEFLALLNSFLKRNAQRIGLSIASDLSYPSETELAVSGIKKLSPVIVWEVAGLIADACVVLELWAVLEALIVQGLLGHRSSWGLVEKLVEKNQSMMLCAYIEHVPELRSSELLSVLKYFLSPTEDSFRTMIDVRKQWESQALLAAEKATQPSLPPKLSNLARDASILLMLAYDGFMSSELCLHYVFGSAGAEGIMLSSAISALDGSEVLCLIRYFAKWLQKYERFPEAGLCPSAGYLLGLKACDSVPSLESVIRGLGLVLDEHFSHLVLNSDFHHEMRTVEKVVSSMALEAKSCCPLDNLMKHLQAEMGGQ